MGLESTEKENNLQEECAWLEALINKQANDKAVARVINIDVKSGSNVGDNYASLITRITLTVILRNGQKSKISLIKKSAHVDKDKLKVLEEIPVFKSETMVYNEVLKKCEALMDEYQDNGEKLWCNLVGFRSYDLILFEDLKVKNYLVADRTKMQDLNHSLLVLHSLARLHGMCYVLMQKGLLSKADTAPFYAELDSPVIDNMYKGGIQMLSHVIDKHWSPEWKEISGRLHKEQDFITTKVRKLFKPPENSFITLCHGDCWTCNMMFKYSPYEEDYPIAMKFLDFQTVHTNSYIFDVIHFLYVSVDAEVRRKNYNKLLTMYQRSLQSTLANYGMEKKAPTMEHIQAEAKRIEYYAFVANIIILPVTTASVNDAFKMDQLNAGCKGMDAFNPIIFQSEQYKSTVQPELKVWFEKGLF